MNECLPLRAHQRCASSASSSHSSYPFLRRTIRQGLYVFPDATKLRAVLVDAIAETPHYLTRLNNSAGIRPSINNSRFRSIAARTSLVQRESFLGLCARVLQTPDTSQIVIVP